MNPVPQEQEYSGDAFNMCVLEIRSGKSKIRWGQFTWNLQMDKQSVRIWCFTPIIFSPKIHREGERTNKQGAPPPQKKGWEDLERASAVWGKCQDYWSPRSLKIKASQTLLRCIVLTQTRSGAPPAGAFATSLPLEHRFYCSHFGSLSVAVWLANLNLPHKSLRGTAVHITI